VYVCNTVKVHSTSVEQRVYRHVRVWKRVVRGVYARRDIIPLKYKIHWEGNVLLLMNARTTMEDAGLRMSTNAQTYFHRLTE